ncbi:MAG TPA: MarR family transcriptional regulator [Actinomycetota bacterium]|nr:MarR family transcriptional regulator [Actinomycetota bacterium]
MSNESEKRRRELKEQIGYAGRILSTAAVMYHSAVAAKVGLGATDEKALDLLERLGPLSAGELSAHSGLAPASVTGLIGRLEAKGFARRIPNPADGRSVLVELNRQNTEAMAGLFEDLSASLNELLDGYSIEQLETILHFCTEAARRQQEATGRLVEPSK